MMVSSDLEILEEEKPLHGQDMRQFSKVLNVPTVVHVTSHHSIHDNRIFYRNCRTLAQRGFDVALVAQHPVDEVREGVRILGIPSYRSRLERVTLTGWRAVKKAMAERPDIIHLHDPELLLWGLLLKLKGYPVIYDVHEDFTQAAGVREWIPGFLRPAVAGLASLLAIIVQRIYTIIIAERYYGRRFPKATMVLNYPAVDMMGELLSTERSSPPISGAKTTNRLIYVGSITESRGAFHHTSLAAALPGSEVHLVGHCPPDLLESMMKSQPELTVHKMDEDGSLSNVQKGTEATGTLIVQGAGWFVPPRTIIERLAENWTAGLAIFPDNEHYREKELTKFFEYMAAGLPVIASNFPVWRQLVEENGLGICVHPEKIGEASQAVTTLASNENQRLQMAEKGRKLLAERYSWQSQADELVALYKKLLK